MRRAFELRPEPVPTLDPRGEYLRRVWREVVYPLAERMGMPLRLPPLQPRSRLAHEAARFAARQGKLDVFHEAVFSAFFECGDDIGRVDVLVGLGRETGLEGGALRQALESREFEAEVVADEELAERLGVRGVPAFVAERSRIVTGMKSKDELRELVSGARKSSEQR